MSQSSTTPDATGASHNIDDELSHITKVQPVIVPNPVDTLRGRLPPASKFQTLVWPRFGLDLSTSSKTVTLKYNIDIRFDTLCIFASRYETGDNLVGLPVFVVAELGTQSTATSTKDLRGTHVPPFPEGKAHVPLGMLSTDHMGYCSFDLGVLSTDAVIDALRRSQSRTQTPVPILRAGNTFQTSAVTLRHLWVLPYADQDLQLDALATGDIGPNYVTLRLQQDLGQLEGRSFAKGSIPSMQSPSILDYRMSPGSFTIASAILIGGDGSECQGLLPSTLATQTFRFYQVARIPGKTIDMTEDPEKGFRSRVDWFRLGYVFEYATEWFPIGHSLGSLSYSLPLAPGEMVRIAIVDWSRDQKDIRTEDTSFSESLEHDALRDRSLSENVTAMLKEWVRGGSVMGGVAASGSANMGMYSLGGAASLGGAYTTSLGTRDLTAETSQKVADAFHQSTSAMRELRSTVVIQDKQKEDAKAQTRIVANYNHSHALTMLYYEVLRHFRVVTRMVRKRGVLLLNFGKRWEFNSDDNVDADTMLDNYKRIVKRRGQLEPALLDQRLVSSFDAMERIIDAKQKEKVLRDVSQQNGDPGATTLIKVLTFTAVTRDEKEAGTDCKIELFLYIKGMPNERWSTHMAVPRHKDGPQFLFNSKAQTERGKTDMWSLYPIQQTTSVPFQWQNLQAFSVKISTDGNYPDWHPQKFKLIGVANDTYREIVLFDQEFPSNYKIIDGASDFTSMYQTIRPPAPLIVPTEPADELAASKLRNHLSTNEFYYKRLFWLNENPNARAAEFDQTKIKISATEYVPVIDLIENRALEVTGDWVAFPLRDGSSSNDPAQLLPKEFGWESLPEPEAEEPYVEQLLTLPTRGVFAEAKLGHCNASEKIDDTRFWDWQKSPIPYQAPDIAPASTESRAGAIPSSVEATNFPQAVVTIQSPQALPDPTGLRAALEVMKTPGIFPNMSASETVGTLLGKLSDNATKMAQSAADAAQKKQDRADQKQDREDKQNDNARILKEIGDSPNLSTEQKSKLINDMYAKEIAGDTTKPTTGGGTGETAPGTQPGKSPGDTSTGGTPPTTGGGGTAPTTGGGGTPPTTGGGGGGGTGTGGTTGGGPTPGPQLPTKPPHPVSTSRNKVLFRIEFHPAVGQVATTVTGTASVTAYEPRAETAPWVPFDPTYVPGTNPPTRANRIKIDQWIDEGVFNGSLILRGDKAPTSGRISISFRTEVPTTDLNKIIGPIRGAPTPSGPQVIPGVIPNWTPEQFKFKINEIPYHDTPKGSGEVVVHCRPQVATYTLRFTSSDSVNWEYTGGADGGGDILGVKGVIKLGLAKKTSEGHGHEMQLPVTYLTGGFYIWLQGEQEPGP